jgi:hypothetical protein
VRVSERDFRIGAPLQLAAGDTRLQVHNLGPDQHELIVVRQSSRLPLRADGLTVDEDSLARVKAGGLEPGAPGAVRELDLHL